ncbi:MAG: FAD-dependent oxidoreductase [Leptolyngbyaceae cyanobacterium bins.302]|nr:FAD-dependent oxidoreductase [Leptolyngbyaceae cyanobacterium bins.302]
MSVDYDVIIFGATPAGIQAAIAAATLKARVALITQGISSQAAPELTRHQALLHLAHTTEQLQHAQSLPLRKSFESPSLVPSVPWKQVDLWLQQVAANIAASYSVAGLAYQGVDVIPAMGEFCRQPAFGVRVGDRLLQARGYLVAIDARTQIPAIAGLDSVGYLTPETLFDDLTLLANCQKIAVIGSSKTAIELGQALNQLGIEITILTQAPRLLPDGDRDLSQILQAQLEADGMQLSLSTTIDQIRERSGTKQIAIGATLLEIDEIMVATALRSDLAALNLDTIGVRWDGQSIWHNQKLQTTHPRIYVCEGRVGDEWFTQVAIAEAAVALKNILFFPWFKINDNSIPLTVHTFPELAWIGLTEEQALRIYGQRRVYILRQSFHTLPKAQMTDNLTGFCKLVVHRDGTLLGAHIFGACASEWIGILALAMQQQLKIGAIAALAIPSPTFAAILQQSASQFRSLQLKHNSFQQDLIDHFFDLRRAWSRS